MNTNKPPSPSSKQPNKIDLKSHRESVCHILRNDD